MTTAHEAATEGTPFVGREAILRRLEELYEAAATGNPQVALIYGSAGIGKTALVREFVRLHSGIRCVAASGEELESFLEFGVVDQLWRSSFDVAPTGERAAIDQLAVGAELLELVAKLTVDDAALVIVDDAQWADGSSLASLAFALRRLTAERVLVIFLCREDWQSSLPAGLRRVLDSDRCARVALAGLTRDDLVTIAGQLDCSLGVRAAERLLVHTGGNPLYVRALLRETDREALSALDTGELAGPLPAPALFASWVLDKLASCTSQAQALARAASTLGVRWQISSAVRLAGLDAGSALLDELVAAGLVECRPQSAVPRFTHPLVQAAIYHDLPSALRSSLHDAAARLAPTAAESLQHRVAACLGVDADLAVEVANNASGLALRGSWTSAASGFLTAARLHPGGEAETWLLSGVECLVLAGDLAAALGMQERVERCRPFARRDYVRSFLAVVSGNRAFGKQLLEKAWTRLDPSERDVAARIANQLAMVALNEGRATDSVDWARRALQSDPALPDRGTARLIELLGLGEMGQTAEALSVSDDVPGDLADSDVADLGALLGRGVVRLWAGDVQDACIELSRAEILARRLGPLSLRVIALYYLADAEYRVGAWDSASMHAELAASLADDAGEVWVAGLAHSVAAFPASGRGEWDRAQTHISLAAQAVAALGDPANQVWLSTAQARLAWAQGNYLAVLARTESLMSAVISCGRAVPGAQPWMLLRAEALAASGRLDEAGVLLDEVAAHPQAQRNAGVEAALARVRGLVALADGRPSEAAAAFEHGLELASRHPIGRLDRALLELDLGALLRRLRRRKAAAGHLHEAREILTHLAAQPFLSRCERELAACGVASALPADEFHARLSPQEQAVATLVTAGLTNREIANQLVVSTKAVEFHLRNAFAKLQVRNRVELTTKFAPFMTNASADVQ